MKKFISYLLAVVVVLAVTLPVEAGGSRSSSRSSSGSSFKSSGSSYKSSSTKRTYKSSTSKKAYKTKSSASFTPPQTQMAGYTFKGQDVFMTAAGTYAIYRATGSFVDCDYDDIMEGDEDCTEVQLDDDDVEALGLEDDEEAEVRTALSERTAAILFFIVMGIFLLLIAGFFLYERHRIKQIRKRRRW